MKESIGYTVTLNLIIIFIVVVFAFLSATLIYFKSNKVGNVIANSIEKYEGYNSYSINEIGMQMSSLGYSSSSIENSCNKKQTINGGAGVTCNLVNNENAKGKNGYCVYFCQEGDYYYYRIRTNMMFNLPIINNLLNIPVYSNTNRLYDFSN